jgi:nucleoside recognition membrane protein YjiH
MSEKEKKVEQKISWKGWVALIILVIAFSGVLQKNPGPLAALDFANLNGQFGTIYENINFKGAGGVGAREGFAFTLTLIPTVMLALGFINVAESLGALKAAEKLFRPLLKPLLGIPGIAGLAFVSTFTSSDVGAVMTKDLVEKGEITDDERTIFVSYQYAASAVITNTFTCGAPLLPMALLPVGIIIVLEMIVKILGANIVRFILNSKAKKNRLGCKEYGTAK